MCACPLQEVPPTLSVTDSGIWIFLHCRLGVENDRMKASRPFPFFLILIYPEREGKKAIHRPLLFGVRFPPRHINNLLSGCLPSPSAPLPVGCPIAARNLHCRLLITYRGGLLTSAPACSLRSPSLPLSFFLSVSLQCSGSEDGCSTGLSGAVFGGLS